MRGFRLKYRGLGLGMLCILSTTTHAGIPVWSFSPIGSPVVALSTTGTATVRYTITNNSKKPHQLLLSSQAPKGISQIGGPCILAAKTPANPTPTCTLTLNINGSALPTNKIVGGPVLCQANSNNTPNANQCYQPSKGDSLNITVNVVSAMIASGEYSDGAGYSPLLANSTNGGKTWAYSVTKSSPEQPDSWVSGRFISSSCSGSNCIAAGDYSTDNYYPLLANSTDSGKTWAYSITKNSPEWPVSWASGKFISSSCSGSNCIAAGDYFDGISYPLLANSTDGGKTWAYSALPDFPPEYLTGGTLTGSSCSGSNCIASGYFKKVLENYPLLLSSTDGGKTWTYINTELPPINTTTSANFQLTSASCSGSNCIVAGSYFHNFSGGMTTPLLANSTDGGKTWVYSITRLSPEWPIFWTHGAFTSSSCSGSNCIAAGEYHDGSATYPLLANSTDGGKTWAYNITRSKPALPDSFQEGKFTSASCSGSNCIAAGHYNNSPSFPLLANSIDGGKTWAYSITKSSPEWPDSWESGQFTSASCSMSNCIAAGQYVGDSGTFPLLANSTDGGATWVYRITEKTPELPTNSWSYGWFNSAATTS